MGCTYAGGMTSVVSDDPIASDEVKTGAPRPKPDYISKAEKAVAEARRDTLEEILAYQSGSQKDERMHDSQSDNINLVNSQAYYSSRNQTIIIFDWDDTILASSAVRRYARFDKNGCLLKKLDDEVKEKLAQLEEQAKSLLELATQLGEVVFVTNAKRPWVDISCRAFMPGLTEIMGTIPKIYAVELLGQDGAGLSGSVLLTETKTRAMRAAVTQFYSRYANQSWKNIVSIGDALFEHHAIRQVVNEHISSHVDPKKCRTKTLKLLDGPTVSGLAIQLRIVYMWLTKMVATDDDVDIDFSADEATVNRWRATFGEVDSEREGAGGS